MASRLLLLLLLLSLLMISLYRWGWAYTWQQLCLGWSLFRQEAVTQWLVAQHQASQLSLESSLFPASLFPLLRFLWTLRCWCFALRSVYLRELLALPPVTRALRQSQAHFFGLAGLSLVFLCAAKCLLWGAPLALGAVHLFFGFNVLHWLHRSYHRAEAKERVLYLNLTFCYFYCLILLLFFYPSVYLLMAAYVPRRRSKEYS